MRKLILSLSLLAGTFALRAQQDAQYTQFFMTKLSYNPGFAGSEDKICATGLYRSQWIGFGNNTIGITPVTIVANVHAPIGSKFGVGINISSDQQGFEQSLNPMLSLAYRYPFKDGSILAGGLGIGFMQKTLAGDKLKPLDEGDALIPSISVSGNALDLNLGFFYTRPTLWRFDNVYAGLSTTHLTGGDVKYEFTSSTGPSTVNNPMKPHGYFMTGGSYSLNPSWALEPNILVKSDFAKSTVDVNAMVMYNDKIRGGVTYRSADAVSVLLGYKFTPNLQVGYSYDITTTNIISYSSGSHEVVLKYCFMPKLKPKPDKDPVPRLTPRFL